MEKYFRRGILMRICVIGPVHPYRGGIAHYTAQLIQALGEAGHAVYAVSYSRQYPGWLYPGVSDKDPSASSIQVDADYQLDPIYPWTWMKAFRRIAQMNPDLVVIQWWTTFWAPAYAWLASAFRRHGVRVVYLVHNVLPHEQRFFDRSLARLALGQGQVFVAQSTREKDRLLALLPGRRVELCAHPVYSFLTGQCIPRSEARRRLGLKDEAPVLLFFGIVRPYKGLKVLLEALARLGEADQSPSLLVAGEFWEDEDSYRQLIERLGLEARVRLEDRYVPNEEAALMFSAADMLVAPYLDGTQSGAAGIALGYGLPMVVTELVAAGITEENRENILVVPSGDATALAAAIRQMLKQTGENHIIKKAPDDWWRLVQTLEALVEP